MEHRLQVGIFRMMTHWYLGTLGIRIRLGSEFFPKALV